MGQTVSLVPLLACKRCGFVSVRRTCVCQTVQVWQPFAGSPVGRFTQRCETVILRSSCAMHWTAPGMLHLEEKSWW